MTASPSTGPVLVGLERIGAAFGRSRFSIRRWIEHEGFPAAQLPNGQWWTSLQAIERWRAEREAEVRAELAERARHNAARREG